MMTDFDYMSTVDLKDELIKRKFPNLCDKIKFDLFLDKYEIFTVEQFVKFITLAENEKKTK